MGMNACHHYSDKSNDNVELLYSLDMILGQKCPRNFFFLQCVYCVCCVYVGSFTLCETVYIHDTGKYCTTLLARVMHPKCNFAAPSV